MGAAFAFSLSAAFSPTLFATLMVMLLSPNPKRMMLAFLLGAYVTSLTVGLVIVSALPQSSAVSTARDTVTPGMDVTLGLIAILVALIVSTSPRWRSEERREKRRLAKVERGPPRWRRALDEGSPRVAFVVGVAVGLPGASFLVALDLLHKQDLSAVATVVCVIAFCLLELMLLELLLLSFAFAPDSTLGAVDRFGLDLEDGRRIAIRAALVIGVLLVRRRSSS